MQSFWFNKCKKKLICGLDTKITKNVIGCYSAAHWHLSDVFFVFFVALDVSLAVNACLNRSFFPSIFAVFLHSVTVTWYYIEKLHTAVREFQVDGTATKKARRASSVCMRGKTSIGASEERSTRCAAWVCTSSLRYVGVAVVRTLWISTASLQVTRCLTGSQCSEWSSGLASVRPRLWQTTLAKLFCRKSPPVRHPAVHCSSPARKRRCCTQLSGRRGQSVDCARGAERECGSCRPLQRFSRDGRTAGWNQWSRQHWHHFAISFLSLTYWQRLP